MAFRRMLWLMAWASLIWPLQSLAGEWKMVACKEYKTGLGMYLCGADGSDVRQLCFLYGEDVSPRISPDRTRILFHSTRGGAMGIWTMNLEGADQQRICDGDQAAWAADGKGVFFRRAGQIFERDLASGKERIASPQGWKDCSFPDASPDGKGILFVAKKADRDAIFAAALDGKEPRCLVTGEIGPAPRWSPDGSRIAFQDGAHIHICEKDGGAKYQLTTTGGIQRWPAWLPDGSAVAYCHGAGLRGPWCICTTSPDGDARRLPTRSAVSILNPDLWEEGRPQIKAISPPRGRIAIWKIDPHMEPSRLRDLHKEKRGWQPLEIGQASEPIKGVVVENQEALVCFCAETAPAYLFSKRLKEAVEILLVGPGEKSEARIESVRVASSDLDKAALEVECLSPDGKAIKTLWTIRAADPGVEITPVENADRVRIRARMELAVVPDRFANDIVLNPAKPDHRTVAPSAPLILGMMREGDAILTVVTPEAEQRIEVIQDEGKRFGAFEVCPAGRRFCISVIAGKAIWQSRRVSAADKGREVKLDWKAPCPATWRLTAWGKVEQESMLFGKKQTEFYDGKRVFIKKDKASGEGLILVYLYDCVGDTPLDVLTPVDTLRNALGLAGWRRTLDVDGLTGYRLAPRQTTWSDIFVTVKSVEYICEKGLVSQEKVFVEHMCDDARPFADGIAQRLNEYGDFGKRAAELLKDLPAEVGNPLVKKLNEFAEKRDSLRKIDEAVDLFAKIKSLAQTDASENAKEMARICREIRAIAEPQRELISRWRELAKRLRNAAGEACVNDPAAKDAADKIRYLAQQVLRNRYYFEEDWRGEDYEPVPFWLGQRPWED